MTLVNDVGQRLVNSPRQDLTGHSLQCKQVLVVGYTRRHQMKLLSSALEVFQARMYNKFDQLGIISNSTIKKKRPISC